MDKGNLSRRGFLQRSLAGLAATGLPLWYAQEVLAEEQEKKISKAAPSDRIVMGAIGIGSPQSRGRAIAHDALNTKQGVQYVAVCDVDGRHRDNAVQDMKKRKQEVKAYTDFRELLADKDIEAVTIATPDHWHALVAIEALRRKKDVYCEKPLTLTIAEGIALTKVARETGRVFQVGSQQRSDKNFRLACELVRNGRLGTIKRVESRIGANPQSPVLPKVDPPRELDWDFWLGPTPKVDYVELERGRQIYTRCHYEFRWWYDYSGGKMTDWGAHHNDIAQWGLGMDDSGPVAVEAVGKEPEKGANRYNCHPTFKVTYTYKNGAQLVCSDNQLKDALDRPKDARRNRHSNGVLFVGEKGDWIFVTRGFITASDKKLLEEKLPGDAHRLYVSNNHMGNFLSCVRNRKPTICPAEVGHRSVTVCHLGVIALRSGKKLTWDPQAQHFVDDAEADKWLSRKMRAPWKLEV
jgi:predicted dehydrogenase